MGKHPIQGDVKILLDISFYWIQIYHWMGYHAEIPIAQTFLVTFLHEPWVEKLLNCIVFVKTNTRPFLFIGVLEEAEFYNIDPLVKIIKDRIQSREARQKLPVSFVYVNTLV